MLSNIVHSLKYKLGIHGLDEDVRNIESIGYMDLQKHSEPNKGTMNIIVTAPTSYDKGKDIAKEFLEGKVIVVNFVRLSQADKQRVFDYLNGVAYTLNTDIKQVNQDTIVYMPCEFVAMKMRI